VIIEVEVEGERCTVALQPLDGAGADGGRFRVVLQSAADGTSVVYEIDARPTELGLSILDVKDGRSTDVALTDRPGGECLVQLPHTDVVVTTNSGRARRAGPSSHGAGEQHVAAPMPGRVVRVLVRPGDEVAARQGLVVVEAMKMENELVSRRAGRVREVLVVEGAPVEAGRLLVVID
jgi:biotin carboxyl carrier protein